MLKGIDVKRYSLDMPYVSKTDRQTILSAALQQTESDGIRNLSLRALAASLGITPNALYRYFPDRAALEVAVAAEGRRQMYSALQQAAGKKNPERAIRSMATAYIEFAREHPHLYEVMIACSKILDEDPEARWNDCWAFVVERVSLVSANPRAPEAAVALWALLHGTATLVAAHAFGKEKPFHGVKFGLDAWFAAATQSKSSQE
jgi:AcrR family transcriptional regulator